jgi:hypothetical protein
MAYCAMFDFKSLQVPSCELLNRTFSDLYAQIVALNEFANPSLRSEVNVDKVSLYFSESEFSS